MSIYPPGPRRIDERFADGLDPAVWTAAYLPAWSSTAAAAATWRTDADGLHLTVPPEQPLWCPDLHPTPLRVSAVQSGTWSGPVGGTRGQQPFRPGLRVREEQPARWGCTPYLGTIEAVCRARVAPGSMFSVWAIGLEDEPDRCGEICLVEVFGDALGADDAGRPTAAVGQGVHAFRDPALHEDFVAPRRALDVAGWHAYTVRWEPDRLTFTVDGEVTRVLDQAPRYPVQLVLGVFDFPGTVPAGSPVPELVVRSVVVTAPGG